RRSIERPALRTLYVGACRSGRQREQPNDEFAAFACACAMRFDRAAVHLDETSDECQAKTEPAMCGIDRSRCSHEEVENVTELVALDTNAVVPDRDHRLVLARTGTLFHLQPDIAALAGVLRRVVQQIADDLFEAHGVA